MTIRCTRCDTPVKESMMRGYKYYCPEHDEDLFSFEVYDDESIEMTNVLLGGYDNVANDPAYAYGYRDALHMLKSAFPECVAHSVMDEAIKYLGAEIAGD